jgi:hypothetical protein
VIVELKTVDFASIQEDERDCMVCKDPYRDTECLRFSFCVAALEEMEMANKTTRNVYEKPKDSASWLLGDIRSLCSFFEKQPLRLPKIPEGMESWMEIARSNLDGMILLRETVKNDIMDFYHHFMGAFHRRQALIARASESEEAVKLPCGHILGFVCAKTWLDSNNTCPYCRQKASLDAAIDKT